MIIASACVCMCICGRESRNATLNVSPRRERYLLAFRVFDIRNAHESWLGGTALSLARDVIIRCQ